MADVMFKKGLRANLPAAIAEGTFHVATDERALYLDIDANTRIRIGDFQSFDTVELLNANANPSETALYYVKDINCLAKWDGTEYIQINRDTGVTSVEVVGDGNVVTAASYNPVNRKLTLTMGKTMAERSYVGEIPEGYTEENIVAYINKKAEETLNAASGGSSESAASVLAALNTYKAEANPRLEALEADTHTHANKAELDKIAEGDKALWDAEKGANAAIAAMKEGATVVTFKGVEDALAAAKTELQGYADTAEADALAAAKTYADGKDAAIAAAKQAGDDAQADVDALAEKVGEVPADKTVVQMISEAQTAATYDDEEIRGLIQDNADAIGVLNGTGEGSVDKKITDAFNDFSTKVTDDAVVNSYKELIDWAATHGSEAVEMAGAITTLENILAGIGGEGEQATVAAHVNAAIEALKIGDYAKAADLAALAERVAAMEAKVADWDDAVAKEHEHANKAELDLIASGDKAKWDAAEAKAHEHANAEELAKIADGDVAKWNTAEQNAKDHADGLNTAMDNRVKVLEAIDHEAYKAYADQAETDAVATAKVYADGLAVNYDAAGAAAEAQAAAQAYADTAVANAKLVWGSF